MKYIRKRLIITGVIVIMGLGLTGCTKTDEGTENGGSVVEAEDLPGTESPEDVEPQAKDTESGENSAAEDTDKEGGQDADISSLSYIPDTEGDLYGSICEIGEKQFTVTEIYVDTVEGGGQTMVEEAPGAEGESPKITVVYDENTAFEKKKIWNGGADHEEKEGSAADLQKGLTTEMWGSYEGDVFHATAIRIVEVILG